jgi:cytochrome c peroxidase
MKTINIFSLLVSGTVAMMTVAGVMGVATSVGAQETAVPPLAALGDPPIPDDNPMSVAKIELGKMLFWDPRLGGDASVSCATCHAPDQGWAFGDDLSRGYPGTVHWRNSQSVINAAYLGQLFWAGSASSLESQAKSAATGAVAGNGESDVMETRLAFIPEYRERFSDVFGTEWPLIGDAWKAIAAFERTMIVNDTPIDRFLSGESDALSPEQLAGMDLFNGKGGCLACHNGAQATDEKYYNLGVPPAERWESEGLAQITFRYELYAKGVTQEMYRKLKDDPGLYFRTKEKDDLGKFRTPPLRYTAFTAPYMHNGAFWDFEEVVRFYNAGGGENDFTDGTSGATKTPLLKPLGLTDGEVENLVAFLEAFSGEELEIEPPKLPPYAALPGE